MESRAGSFRRIPSITACSVPIAISVRLRRGWLRRRRRNRGLGFTSFMGRVSPRSRVRRRLRVEILTTGGTEGHRGWHRGSKSIWQTNRKRCHKNFGDAHRVPFVVACCSCLVLFAAFLLCFLFGCHGSILPFHSSWNFATVFCCN